MKQKLQKAFTLIELLVVISVIGVLSSIVLISINNSRTSARDSKRTSDIRQLTQALELYYNEHGNYPPCTAAVGGDQFCGTCSASGNGEFQTALQPLVSENFISRIPVDPLSASCYSFEYYTKNQPDVYGRQCAGMGLDQFSYVIRFGTEKLTTAGYPLYSQQRVSGREYCAVGN